MPVAYTRTSDKGDLEGNDKRMMLVWKEKPPLDLLPIPPSSRSYQPLRDLPAERHRKEEEARILRIIIQL